MRLLLTVLVFGVTQAGAADPVLAFPADKGIVTLRLELSVNGQASEIAWGAFLDKLFDHFDRDADGVLSATEAARVFPLPLPNRRVATIEAAKLDRVAFKNAVRTAGFTPIVVLVEPAPPESLVLGDALVRALDRDRDGKLSTAEVRNAPALLRRFDEDEDEVLTAAELLATARGVIPVAGLKLAEDKAADAVLQVPIGGTPTLTKNDRFQLNGTRLSVPAGNCVVSMMASDSVAGLRTTKAFYLAQFKSLAGDKPATKALFDDDPTAQGLASLFDAADRNGDAKLTRAELEAFFDLVESGVSCRVVVTAEDRGRNLFDHFDTNSDGRLDLLELTRGAAFDTIPAAYRLTVTQGSVGESFGPVPIGTVAKPKPLAKVAATGPRWFQAMDRNGDGSVSANEFLGSPELFAKMDTDRDGRISPREAGQ